MAVGLSVDSTLADCLALGQAHRSRKLADESASNVEKASKPAEANCLSSGLDDHPSTIASLKSVMTYTKRSFCLGVESLPAQYNGDSSS